MDSLYRFPFLIGLVFDQFFTSTSTDPEAFREVCGYMGSVDFSPFFHIAGGKPVDAGTFWPWVVSIKFGRRRVCGGVLVTDKMVLTAAHCLIDRDESGKRVRIDPKGLDIVLGDYDLTKEDEFEETKFIKTIHYHPQWRPDRIEKHDIALIELETRTKHPHKNLAICLPHIGEKLPKPRASCIVYGYGQNEKFEIPEKLLHAGLSIKPKKFCKWYWNQMAPKTFCAGVISKVNPHRLRGTCQDDSGGPLFCYDTNKEHWSVYGIISFGHLICLRKPSIFTDVTSYAKWIRSTIDRQDSYKVYKGYHIILRPYVSLRRRNHRFCMRFCCEQRGCQSFTFSKRTRSCNFFLRTFCEISSDRKIKTRDRNQFYLSKSC